MLSLFIFHCYCQTINLTKKNYHDIFNSTSKKSIFLYFQGNQSLSLINRDFEFISSIQNYQKYINFVSIDCNKEKQLCSSKFSFVTSFPSFFWFDSAKSPYEEYKDYYKKELFIKFIDEHIGDNLIKLKKLKNISSLIEIINNKYRNDQLYDLYFVFNISYNENKKSITTMKAVTRHLSYLPVLFFFVNDTQSEEYHKPILHTFAPHTNIRISNDPFLDKIIAMQGEFTYENVEKFIRTKSIHKLSQHSPMIDELSIKYKIPVAVFVNYDSEGNDIERFANITERIMLTTQTTCKINPYICRYCNQWPKNNKTYLAVLNRSIRTFWVYDKTFDENELMHFMDDVNDHHLKGYGPGPSVFGNFLSFFYDMRERGGMPYYTAHVPIMSLVIVGSILLYVFSGSIAEKYKALMARREAERRQKEKIAELERQKRNRNNLKNK